MGRKYPLANEPAPAGEVRGFILDMIESLTALAVESGQVDLAKKLRRIDRSGAAPQDIRGLGDSNRSHDQHSGAV